MRALNVDAKIRLERPRLAKSVAAFALATPDRVENGADDYMQPLSASVADFSDYHVVMGWLCEVDPSRDEMVLLRGRRMSPPVSWACLAARLGVSDAAARERYRRLLRGLVRAANREPARRYLLRCALQDRNRKHRGQGA